MPERSTGIRSYAAHVPAFGLASTRFGETAPLEGARRVRSTANHDEDALTLAVEAASRVAAEADPHAPLLFATSEPPYLDKSTAATLHAALELPAGMAAADVHGLRSGGGALTLALACGGTAVLADLRTQPPGAPDELGHGDAAAAFTTTRGDGAAAVLAGAASTTQELLDRWRLPGERHATAWDERFTAEVYAALVADAATRALGDAGLDGAQHVVVSCANPRAAAAARRALGARADAELEALTGHTGAAHLGLLLADALDRARPGEAILAVGAADGVDAFVLVAGDSVVAARRSVAVREQLARRTALSYERHLRRRRLLDLQGARRPEPAAPAAPPMLRRSRWKFGLVAERCARCGAVASPPGPVCAACGAIGPGEPHALRDRGSTVVSFTADHLSPTPDPPVVLAVVDIDGGGRRSVEVTDVPERGIAVGDRVVATFRRLHSAGGVHNYFWKVRPEAR